MTNFARASKNFIQSVDAIVVLKPTTKKGKLPRNILIESSQIVTSVLAIVSEKITAVPQHVIQHTLVELRAMTEKVRLKLFLTTNICLERGIMREFNHQYGRVIRKKGKRPKLFAEGASNLMAFFDHAGKIMELAVRGNVLAFKLGTVLGQKQVTLTKYKTIINCVLQREENPVKILKMGYKTTMGPFQRIRAFEK